MTAVLISEAVALKKIERNSAIVPVTKGVAALVPLNVADLSSGARLLIASPHARNPRRPIEPARFE
jgi:hypothetical protein